MVTLIILVQQIMMGLKAVETDNDHFILRMRAVCGPGFIEYTARFKQIHTSDRSSPERGVT